MFCDPLTPQLLYYLGIKDQEIINLYIIGLNCCVSFPQQTSQTVAYSHPNLENLLLYEQQMFLPLPPEDVL